MCYQKNLETKDLDDKSYIHALSLFPAIKAKNRLTVDPGTTQIWTARSTYKWISFSKYKLRDPWLVESADVELQVQKDD